MSLGMSSVLGTPVLTSQIQAARSVPVSTGQRSSPRRERLGTEILRLSTIARRACLAALLMDATPGMVDETPQRWPQA